MGSLCDDDPHPTPGVGTIDVDPFGDWEVEDMGYLYDPRLMVGTTQRVLTLAANFWDAFDHKREVPIIPAAGEVCYGADDAKTWDLAIPV